MNYLKNKWALSVSICITVVLGAIVAAIVLQRLEFPFTWVKISLFMSFVGTGGIGVVIALYVHNIPQQEKHHRRRLEVKAWKDLGVQVYGLIVAAVSIYMLMKKADSERNFAMIIAAGIIGIWIPVGHLVMKKRLLKGLDERERLIHERAKTISDSFFAAFCLMGLLGLWGWVGLKTPVPVYVPVLIVFGLGAIAEILKPLIILIQCKMERLSETEGGAA
jgi:archaellum biogenesis protein FlaJ (TadC family)